MPAPSDAKLVRLLKSVTRMADLLPRLHEALLDATGGVASVLLLLDTRSRELRPLSGYRVASLPLDPWLHAADEQVALRDALATGLPVLLPMTAGAPSSLAEVLGAPNAGVITVPVTGSDPGVLVLGLTSRPAPAALIDAAAPVVDAFALALERGRLEREVALQRELRDLLQEFARSATARLDIAAGLSVICHGAARLFAADRATLWLHERRARELVQRASSDASASGIEARVSVEDALSVAATALRRPTAEIVMSAAGDTGLSLPVGIAIPLRGRRRALGALVIEGVRVDPGAASDTLARADELGRQLSVAIENAQLLEGILASRNADSR